MQNRLMTFLRIDLNQVLPVYTLIFIEILTIMLGDFAEYAAGITNRYHVVRDIFSDDAACTDHGVFTDLHTGQDDDSRADPGIFTDVDILIVLEPAAAEFRVDRVVGCCDCDIRTEHDLVPDIDVAVIDQSQVEIGIHIGAEVEVVAAPICTERKLDV